MMLPSVSVSVQSSKAMALPSVKSHHTAADTIASDAAAASSRS